MQRAFIDFGGTPDLGNLGIPTQTQPWLAQIDPSTQALSQQNTQSGTSLLARLQKQLADANRSTKNQLAARGILFSGETGYQLSENALQNKQATYDAGKQLLDYLSGAYSAVAQREQDRQFQLMQAQQDAAVRQQELQFRQQQMAQEAALAAQANAAAMAAANAGGGGGGMDVGAYIDSMMGGGGAPAQAPMPSAQELAAARAVARKAARFRSPEEKALIQAFNQNYGPVLSY